MEISKHYIIVSYRFGNREGHSRVVGLVSNYSKAAELADAEVERSKGFYSAVVYSNDLETGRLLEIYESKARITEDFFKQAPMSFTQSTDIMFSEADLKPSSRKSNARMLALCFAIIALLIGIVSFVVKDPTLLWWAACTYLISLGAYFSFDLFNRWMDNI